VVVGLVLAGLSDCCHVAVSVVANTVPMDDFLRSNQGITGEDKYLVYVLYIDCCEDLGNSIPNIVFSGRFA